jgi:hypothetical protein
MKYFLPDSQDTVDPSFDFETERRSATRLRHRDDLYGHELFTSPAYDGILVSKGIVDGFGASAGRYTLAQRHRLLRLGAHDFFRTNRASWGPLPIMGDCGAFTYVREERPPYSVDEVLSFYTDCGFDLGLSVDHVILGYNSAWDGSEAPPADVVSRQTVTLELAAEFLATHGSQGLRLVPLGVAQGWSPGSYAHAVSELQKMGYGYIAIGGMVPLKTSEILASLRAINQVRRHETRLHLLGVTRTESIPTFAELGVASFDSTSPLRQAFKDDRNNYHTLGGAFTAIRVPQVEGNPRLQKAISSGRVSQERARTLEQACLEVLAKLDANEASIREALDALARYDELCGVADKYEEDYRATLTQRPWKSCGCDVCRVLGHHVILFRGAERNRRRGLHNTWVFYRRLYRELGLPMPPASTIANEPTGALA